MKSLIMLIVTMLALSCSQPEIGNIVNSALTGDRTVPALIASQTQDLHTIRLTFSESITVSEVRLEKGEASWQRTDSRSVQITSSVPFSASEAQSLFIRVSDMAFNSSAFLLSVYGKNNDIPRLLINEFSSRGTRTQPDRIELEIRSDGNLSGLCAMDGTKGNENSSFILPDLDVKRGDYVIIYWTDTPQETVSRNSDGSAVYHLGAGSSTGLGSNNGVFVLYQSAGLDDDIIDALVYSDGKSSTFSGFGSASVEASVRELAASGQWTGPAADCDEATSTRTLSRWNGNTDSNSCSDFYITVTRGQTFGSTNSSLPYVSDE